MYARNFLANYVNLIELEWFIFVKNYIDYLFIVYMIFIRNLIGLKKGDLNGI